jgi:hypothetical protein
MRIKIAILILLLQPIIMKSQNATATLGNVSSCAGESILVPFDVMNFNDIGAMTIYIGYDTNAADFISLQNINPSVPGSLTFYAVNGQISIAYSSTSPFSISGEKLFDLNFTFLGDSTLLPFNPGTEIANSNLEVIPLDTFPGSIHNSIQLIEQPDSVQSYPDNDVTFRITSLGNPDYHWQEDSGSGWINLQNNNIYSGVTTDTLTVYDVPLAFNGNLYRCVLTAGNCTINSDIALLEVALAFPVATVGTVTSCPENEVLDPLFVGDFIDVIEFTFNISFNTTFLTFLSLENIHPDLLPGIMNTTPLNNPPGITIHWENTTPVTISSGKLFDLKFDYEAMDLPLAFEEGTLVLNSFSNPINITLNDGAVNQHEIPLITAQPQNDTVLEDDVASFTVLATGADEYLWQISTDGGSSWTNLSNTPPYYNINTATLTINPAAWSMNEYQFACRLDNNYCTVFSSASELIVDTLTFITDPGRKETIQVSPVPFHDKIHITVTPGYFPAQVNVYNIHGILVGSFRTGQTQLTQSLEYDFSAYPAGTYLINVLGTRNSITTLEQRVIIKSN